MRKTAVMQSEVFLEHDPGWGHPESPDRLRAVYQAVQEEREDFLFPEVVPADEEILSLVHTRAHIRRVAATAGKPYELLDPDTHTSPRSYEAAMLAAGAVVEGVRLVTNGEVDNVAALVRPPGHHAEKDRTSGFCLFNNVAVGARYGLERLGLQRVLIVDWDLHHGNGTQHAFYDTSSVLYFSTHQYPYFPGTGGLHETGEGEGEGFTVNVPLPGGQDDRAYARIMNSLLVPLARQYRPELIMVSAGYDIYGGDPLGTMSVTRDGFAYLTRVLVELAGELCAGRLVLALEGGYNLKGLADGVLATLKEMRGEEVLSRDAARELASLDAKGLQPLAAAMEVAKKYWTI